MHRPGTGTRTHNWGSGNPALTIDDLADRRGLGTYSARPFHGMLLSPASFQRKVSRCFNHFDTSGAAPLQQAMTRLNGARYHAIFFLLL